MTQTTVNQICNRQYTDAIVDVTSEQDIESAFVQRAAEAPEMVLYELLATLWRLGVDVFDIVPCVLEEIAAD